MLRRLSIAGRIFLLLALSAMYALAMAAVFSFTTKRIEHASVEEMGDALLRMQRTKIQLATHSMAETLGQLLRHEASPAARELLVRRAVQDIRFELDGSGYYFVFRGTINIALPPRPQLQGRDLSDLRDSQGVYLVRELAQKANQGGGFVRYRFPLPSGHEEEPKLGYAEPIPGTDMWIGTGLYLGTVDREQAALAHTMDMLFARHMTAAMLVFLASLALMGLVTVAVARSIVQPIAQATRGAERIASGDLDVTLPATGKDEASRMQAALNHMARTLKHDMEVIQARTAEAEEQTRIARMALQQRELANEEVVRQVSTRVESLRKITMAVSHQLRNPMTIIGGLARVLARKPEMQREYLEYLDGILEAAARIERITQVVGDYSAIRLGQASETDVEELVNEARSAASRRAAALARQVEWKLSLEPLVACLDRNLLAMALAEVLENAVESLPPTGGVVSIHASSSDEFLVLEVADNGRGIPSSELPYVLDPFYTTKAVGIGIGLSKADRIIQEHGGLLYISSEEGRGTTVSIRLPMSTDFRHC